METGIRKIFFVVCCLFAVNVVAQTDTSGINRTDAVGRKQGVWKKYEKGVLVYEGQFKNDVPYGVFKYYHANGGVKTVSDFRQGVHKVQTTLYHENGHKASEGLFVDYQKQGTWHYYTNTDILIAVENYDHGKRNGTWKIFSPKNGILLEESNYSGNRLNGIHKTYYINGELSLEENYIDGKLNGRCTAYYPKKIISSVGNYHNGFRIGTWDVYDTQGKVRSTVEYKDKKVLKTYIYLYSKGQSQKINQDMVAYFLKRDNKAVAVLTNGTRIELEEDIDKVSLWVDFMVFTRIAPRVIASTDAIVGYKEVEDSDNDAITIKLRPDPGLEIYSEGNEAKMVKALFNHEKPVEE